jgi:hypothetical protein
VYLKNFKKILKKDVINRVELWSIASYSTALLLLDSYTTGPLAAHLLT